MTKTKKKTSRNVVALPAGLFGADVTAERIAPLRMKMVKKIGGLQQLQSVQAIDDLCQLLAEVWPAWTVIDPGTGELLPNPVNNPEVFMELEPAQFQWFGGEGLVERPI